MTVAAASDFQLRPAIFSERLSLLRLTKYRFGNPTCNLEHRRVKLRKPLATDESRWLRVERKALVFFPTLNKRLSHYQRTIPAILRRGRFAIAREFSHALHSLPRLSVCDSGRDMSIDMRATFCASPISVLGERDRKVQRFPTTARVGSSITSHISSWVKCLQATIIAISRVTAGNFPSSRKVARDPKPLIGKSAILRQQRRRQMRRLLTRANSLAARRGQPR